MAQYDVADIIGKTLYPTRPVKVYDHPDGTVIGTIATGRPAGIVYSWVNGSDGTMWWMFDAGLSNMPKNTYNSYYIPQESGVFNVQALRQQGVITIDEKIALEKAAEEKKDTLGRIGDMVKWIGLTIAGALITKAVIERSKK